MELRSEAFEVSRLTGERARSVMQEQKSKHTCDRADTRVLKHVTGALKSLNIDRVISVLLECFTFKLIDPECGLKFRCDDNGVVCKREKGRSEQKSENYFKKAKRERDQNMMSEMTQFFGSPSSHSPAPSATVVLIH